MEGMTKRSNQFFPTIFFEDTQSVATGFVDGFDFVVFPQADNYVVGKVDDVFNIDTCEIP